MLVNVALPRPLPPLTYEFPDELGAPQIGAAVEVPLRKKIETGFITELNVASVETFKPKAINAVLDKWPRLEPEYLKFLQWAADYYHYPLGEVIEAALPPKMILKKDPQFIHDSLFKDRVNHLLSDTQATLANQIQNAIESRTFSSFLLQGVTGSGKTEVYLAAADYALQQGGSVLILVPEISLTPQLFSRVRKRLGNDIAILHSSLTEKQRSEQWHLLDRGIARVVVGARSTIFAPAKNIRLIVIDEEHEGAFKQEDRFRYHARDLAIMRAKQLNATVVLGSATPSLETLHNVSLGKTKLLELPERITGSKLPDIEVLDLCKQKVEKSISPRLRVLLSETLARGKQSMLFLNRRGHASCIICGECGHIPQCPNCSVSLTFYAKGEALRCHYCAYSETKYSKCASCGTDKLEHGTLGTESLESEVKELFPKARVLRMDTENLAEKGKLEAALLAIQNGEADIIVGTQMIAKGHDFSGVHLVAIVNADSTTSFPDFRASERSFQLFTQVAGRAGRSNERGKVVIQTFNPEHPAIKYSSTHNFRAFAAEELSQREAFNYPPYCRIARILISDASTVKARNIAESISKHIQSHNLSGLEVLGPAPALLHKLKNKHRWNLLLKCKDSSLLHRLLKTELKVWRERLDSSTMMQVDVDPVSLV